MTTYYEQCRAVYAGSSSGGDREPIYTVTAQVFGPGREVDAGAALRLTSEWGGHVAELARAASAALDDDTCLYRPPGLDASLDPARRLGSVVGMPGLEAIAEIVCGQLEESLFDCHVVVDKAHVYRQLPRPSATFSGGSWMWHADGHPAEFLKVLVYLTDVDEESSAFQLLWSDARGRALRVAASPMEPGNWASGEARAGAVFDEDFVESWRGRGYVPRTILGPAGTTVLFTTNVVHRGTVARSRPRDALILRLRPALEPGPCRFAEKANVDRYTYVQDFAS
jgi:hypothetical protein